MKKTVSVTFEPGGRIVQCQSGEMLIDLARSQGVHINASCGGSGVCGKCRIIIEKGGVEGGKSEKISAEDFEKGVRLACSSVITDDVTIRVPTDSSLHKGGLSLQVPVRHKAMEHHFDIDSLRKEGLFFRRWKKLPWSFLLPLRQTTWRMRAGWFRD